MDNDTKVETSGKRSAAVTYTIVGLLVGVLLGVLIGINISFVEIDSTPILTISYDRNDRNEYQAGFEAARTRLEERGYLQPVDTEVSTTDLYGTVTNVSSDSIIVEVVPRDPLGDIVERTITVTSATEINHLVDKTPEEIQADEDAFAAEMNTNSDVDDIVFPESFNRKIIALKDIEIGNEVTVTAGEAITITGDIEATSIEVQSIPVVEDVLLQAN